MHANTLATWVTPDAASGVAVKVFKTSILVFKDRDRYVTGEFRFRRGYAKSNPRKMVRLWAEKEFRNLNRYVACVASVMALTSEQAPNCRHTRPRADPA